MINYFKYQWDATERRESANNEVEDVFQNTKSGLQNVIADEVKKNEKFKQNEIKKFIAEEKMKVCSILETYLKTKNISKVVLWVIEKIPSRVKVYCSLTYASNSGIDRRRLNAHGMFLPYMVSDHSPILMIFLDGIQRKVKYFRFANYVAEKKEFLEVKHENLFEKDESLKNSMKDAQFDADNDPFNVNKRKEATRLLNDYTKVAEDELKFLHQKAKISWLREGDKNTTHFHNILETRKHKNRVEYICDEAGTRYMEDEAKAMIVEVSDKEIKEALFDINTSKASATLITLVPKIDAPNKILDLRLIACCNVLYKCVSKILTNRIKEGLSKVASINQSAFILGRRTQDNILLTQELSKGYNKKHGAKRCAIKIDIQKAYDIVSWKFLEEVLLMISCHEKMLPMIYLGVPLLSKKLGVKDYSSLIENVERKIHPEDGVATINPRRPDIHGDGVRDSVTASGHGRLKVDLEPSTWRRLLRNLFSSTTIRDENPIRTLRDYSKPSHEGYRNTIELLVGNNVVPLLSDTIRLVQNGCSFHGLRYEDPNQHLKDFLKLVDSLDLDGENMERTRLRLFQFSLCDQASNWLKRLPAGSITTRKDLTTRFLAQYFLPGRNSKLRNDILMFRQHHGESLSEAWTQSLPHVRSEVVPTTFSIAWKILTKPLLNMIIAYRRSGRFQTTARRDDQKIDTVLKAITDRITGALPSDTVKNLKLRTSLVLSARSYPTEDSKCSTYVHERKDIASVGNLGYNKDDEGIEWLDVEEPLDLVDTSEESVYESLIKEMPKCSLNYNFRIKKGHPRNLKIPCMISHKFIGNAYIDVDLPMNIMSLAYYNSIRKNGYEYRGINFVRLGRDMHVFIGNMSNVIDFTILENIETNIDPRLSHMIFGRPFIEIACLAINIKHGLMTFTYGTKEITFKTPYKDPKRSELSSEGHDLLSSRVILSEDDYDRGCRKPSDLEDGFYRDIIKLGPEYVTGMDDEGEVTKFLIKNEEEIFTNARDSVRIYPDDVASPAMQKFENFQVIFDKKKLGRS
ncbi:protein kinase-like domain, concanavalin A-like lectin/glucanase domain protein [Tanacetum coccineum]